MSLLREILWESSSSDESDDTGIRPRKIKVFLPRVDRFAKWDDESFLARFRVSKTLARGLALHLEQLLKTATIKNCAISPMQQVLIALEFYACGSFQRCLGDTAGVHRTSVSRIIFKVSKASIARMRPQWVYMPKNAEEIQAVATKFYELSGFPKVAGAIDCTHIPILSPGAAIQFSTIFAGVFACCVQLVFKKSVISLAGAAQALGGLFGVIGMLLYPWGWGARRVKSLCGENSEPYIPGDCSIGWSLFVCATGVALVFLSSAMSKTADKASNSDKVQFQIDEGKQLICLA